MTTPVYRFVKDTGGSGAGLEAYAIYASSGINTGDMVQWDIAARVATANLLGSGSIFLGVSETTNPVVSLGTPSVPLTGGKITVKSQGVHFFKTTAAEIYSHLDPIYQGADVQTVSKAGSTRMIGRIWLPDGSQVTGATGTNVNVLVMGNMTNDSSAPSSNSNVL